MTDDEVAQEAERWLNVVLQGRADGSEEVSDEVALASRSRLTIYAPYDGIEVYAEVALAEDNDA